MHELARETKETRVRVVLHRNGRGQAAIRLGGALAASGPGPATL